MMELYSKSYSKIAKRAKTYLQDEDNEEEDGPVDKLPPPDKQILNFLKHKPLKRNEWYRYFDIHFPEEIIQKKVKSEINSYSPRGITIEPHRTMSQMSQSEQPRQLAFRSESENSLSSGLFQRKGMENHISAPIINNTQNIQNQPIFFGILPQNQHGYSNNMNGMINSSQIMTGQPIFMNNFRGGVSMGNTTSTFPQMMQLNGSQIAIIPHNPYQQQIPNQSMNIESNMKALQRPLANQFGHVENQNRQNTFQGIKTEEMERFSQPMQSVFQNSRKEDVGKHIVKPVLLHLQEQALANAIRSRDQPQLQLRENMMQMENNNNNDFRVKNEDTENQNQNGFKVRLY